RIFTAIVIFILCTVTPIILFATALGLGGTPAKEGMSHGYSSQTQSGDHDKTDGLTKAYIFHAGLKVNRPTSLWKSAILVIMPDLDMLIILSEGNNGTHSFSKVFLKVQEKTTHAAKSKQEEYLEMTLGDKSNFILELSNKAKMEEIRNLRLTTAAAKKAGNAGTAGTESTNLTASSVCRTDVRASALSIIRSGGSTFTTDLLTNALADFANIQTALYIPSTSSIGMQDVATGKLNFASSSSAVTPALMTNGTNQLVALPAAVGAFFSSISNSTLGAMSLEYLKTYHSTESNQSTDFVYDIDSDGTYRTPCQHGRYEDPLPFQDPRATCICDFGDFNVKNKDCSEPIGVFNPDSISYGELAMFLIGVAILIWTTLQVYLKREEPDLKARSPPCCFYILMGCLIGEFGIIIDALSVTQSTCYAKFGILALAFGIVFR
ncbi:hypothetical protein HDU99_001079, partial [Rhizoclosmatium hyalinum]